MATKILIDSSSDISKDEAEKLGVSMLPMVITFGEEEFFDGVDLTPHQFYEKLTTNKNHPKTSQISPYRFEEEFERLTANGDDVVAITLSSKLSGTYESACRAAQNFEGKVFVVDSLSATIGERFLCEYALKLDSQGVPAKDIASKLDEAKKKLHIFGLLETLEYLKKGGRISSAVAFVGGMLNIKPIVEVVEGEVKMAGKAMGSKRGMAMLNSIAGARGEIDYDMPHGILWSGLDQNIAEEYKASSFCPFADKDEVCDCIVGSTIGTHIGPGVIGVAFFEK